LDVAAVESVSVGEEPSWRMQVGADEVVGTVIGVSPIVLAVGVGILGVWVGCWWRSFVS
jgi:hypothetical protein